MLLYISHVTALDDPDPGKYCVASMSMLLNIYVSVMNIVVARAGVADIVM